MVSSNLMILVIRMLQNGIKCDWVRTLLQ